jgi:hypothetical protein
MKSADAGYSADIPFSVLCSTCKHLQIWESKPMNFQCVRGIMSSDCAARSDNSGYSFSGRVRTLNSCRYFESGTPLTESASRNSPANRAILDNKPAPKLPRLLITGLFVSVIWAAGILIYGKVETDLVIGAPIILTFLSGVPLGSIAFTILRLLKNEINKGATAIGQKVGGNLFGWIVSTLLPWVSPVIVDFFMATFVFHAKIF